MQTIPSRNPPNTQRGSTTPQHPRPSSSVTVVPPSGFAASSSPGRHTNPTELLLGEVAITCFITTEEASEHADQQLVPLPLCHTTPGCSPNLGAAGWRPGQEGLTKCQLTLPAACLLPECDPFSFVSSAVLKWDFSPALGDLTSAYIIGKALDGDMSRTSDTVLSTLHVASNY